jgi:hypothetical protein
MCTLLALYNFKKMIKQKIASYAVSATLILAAAGLAGAVVANAATTMPALYNSAGIEVNNGNTTPLATGYYYLAPGASLSTQVYYYGNGTYYDSTTGTYGGSVADPNGTAGVTINGSSAPGVPDTGAGGNAVAVAMTLLASGLVVAAGATYLFRSRVPFLS